MYLSIIEGDLLDATEDYIVHQCNCVSTQPRGIAKQIFQKYSFANTYTNSHKRIPGTCDVIDNVVNMYAQYYPSIAKYPNDNSNKRIYWFNLCLEDMLSKIKPNSTIAMPYLIGCGLAGGNWLIYEKLIENFSNKYKINIKLYKKT